MGKKWEKEVCIHDTFVSNAFNGLLNWHVPLSMGKRDNLGLQEN